MKENIHNWKDETEVGNYLRKILNKEAGDGSGLIYGMGHAIYTLSDPRAVALKRLLVRWRKRPAIRTKWTRSSW